MNTIGVYDSSDDCFWTIPLTPENMQMVEDHLKERRDPNEQKFPATLKLEELLEQFNCVHPYKENKNIVSVLSVDYIVFTSFEF